MTPSTRGARRDAYVVSAAVGAAVGAAVAAATGGDIEQGTYTGAISGALSAIGGAVGGVVGVIAAGAAAGAINASLTGGDIGLGALIGGVSAAAGYGIAQIPLPSAWYGDLAGFVLAAASGAAVGATAAALYGGDVGEGAAYGAAGSAISYAIQTDLPDAINNSLSSNPRFHLFVGVLLDKIPQSWLDHAATFGAGLGDVLSFGLTKVGRKALDIDDRVNYQSGVYTGGQVTGVVVQTVLTAGTTTGAGAGGGMLRMTITGYTKHGLNQAISREGGGVASRAILNAVKNPAQVVRQANGTIKFVGSEATVILNSAGKVVSTWASKASGLRW